MKNNTISYRVGQVEKRVNSLDKKIDFILTNHLPDIEKQLIKLNTKVSIYSALNIGAIIVGLIISKMFL